MSLLIWSILVFLGVSLLLYVLFGGADFGAGVLELFLGKEKREDQLFLISQSVAPVWEANHVWLILCVVILFVGFPKIYTYLTIYLHIPVLAILVGIVARGSAFTFRHYDTYDQKYYKIYSRIFVAASIWTSLFLGILAGASILGKINPNATSFEELYLHPWLNIFCFTMGLFTCTLFSFLASVYLVGEAQEQNLKKIFQRKIRVIAICVLFVGALVFFAGEINGFHLVSKFLASPLSILSFIIATILWIPFWKQLLKTTQIQQTRMLGGAIVSFVILGWYGVEFPIAIRLSEESGMNHLTFQNTSAPKETLIPLLWALCVGITLIFPALAFLLKIFKGSTFRKTTLQL